MLTKEDVAQIRVEMKYLEAGEGVNLATALKLVETIETLRVERDERIETIKAMGIETKRCQDGWDIALREGERMEQPIVARLRNEDMGDLSLRCPNCGGMAKHKTNCRGEVGAPDVREENDEPAATAIESLRERFGEAPYPAAVIWTASIGRQTSYAVLELAARLDATHPCDCGDPGSFHDQRGPGGPDEDCEDCHGTGRRNAIEYWRTRYEREHERAEAFRVARDSLRQAASYALRTDHATLVTERDSAIADEHSVILRLRRLRDTMNTEAQEWARQLEVLRLSRLRAMAGWFYADTGRLAPLDEGPLAIGRGEGSAKSTWENWEEWLTERGFGPGANQ